MASPPQPQDDIIRYRATLRGRALEQKMSSVEYDLLTGDEKIEFGWIISKDRKSSSQFAACL